MGLIPGSSVDEGRNKDLPRKKEIFIDKNLDDLGKREEANIHL